MDKSNDSVQKVLKEGETIRWSGCSQPFGLFDEEHKTSTISSFALALAVGGILSGGYWWQAMSQGMELKPGVMGFCICVGLLMLYGPFRNKKSVLRLRYAITDKRILVASTEKERVLSMPLSAIDGVRVEKAGDGTSHIRFGSSVFEASRKKTPDIGYRRSRREWRR
jgi:hypothetical protein